jgi:hypothetical protein
MNHRVRINDSNSFRISGLAVGLWSVMSMRIAERLRRSFLVE